MVAIVALAVLLVVMIFAGSNTQPFLETARTTISEEPLEKNSMLMLRSGESYVYEYRMQNSTFNMTFNVRDAGQCTVIGIAEAAGSQSCVDEWGNDPTGANTTLANPMMIIFKPWMLAVEDGWSWGATMRMNYEDYEKDVMETRYSVVRTETFGGRRAYVVKISAGEGTDTFLWVDAVKRILLREMGQGYEVVLVSGLQPEEQE